MKTSTRMMKILNNSEYSKGLKVLKLETLAFQCIPGSIMQGIVIEKIDEMKREVLEENPGYFNDLIKKVFPVSGICS